jgi:hypothetical protein
VKFLSAAPTHGCLKASKKRAHNIISTGFAKALAPALSTAGLTQPNTTIDIKSNLYLMSDTTAWPFDISFNPNPTGSHLCPFTTIGADITITAPPASPNPQSSQGNNIFQIITANADNNLQKNERRKLGHPDKAATQMSPFIRGKDVISEIYRKNMILLPFTIDPWGCFGPMLQSFLTSTHHPHQKPWRNNRPYANIMYKCASDIWTSRPIERP